MCHKLDRRFFSELSAMSPEQVCRRSLCEYDADRACFRIPIISRRYEVFPAQAEVIHEGFDDPPYLTREVTDEEEALQIYRRVRDEIRAFVETLPDKLQKKEESI